jgi:hypothetical protein
MSLLPSDSYRKTRGIHRRGTRALQPAYNTVLQGTLYFVTDEFVIEQAGASAWESYSGPSSGAWVALAFNAGDYTGSGAMTWTVAVGDFILLAYAFLNRKTVIVSFEIATSTVGGVADQFLIIALPAAITPLRTMRGSFFYNDASGALTLGQWTAFATTPALYLYKLVGNWTLGADGTRVVGNAIFEIT